MPKSKRQRLADCERIINLIRPRLHRTERLLASIIEGQKQGVPDYYALAEAQRYLEEHYPEVMEVKHDE